LNASPPEPARKGRRSLLVLIVFLGATILVVATVPALMRSCIFEPVERSAQAGMSAARAVQEAARAVRQTLQVEPQVTIETKVIQNQVSPIAELAVAQRDMNITFFWSQEWLRSKKTIELNATFQVKAGFDLEKPISVAYDGVNRLVIITLPPAEVLSVERIGATEYEDKSGWWNRVNEEDRQVAFNGHQQAARKHANESTLKAEAERLIVERLEALLNPLDIEFTIRFSDTVRMEGGVELLNGEDEPE